MNEKLATYLIKQAMGRARRQVRAARQRGQPPQPIGANSAFGAQMRSLEQQDAARRGIRAGKPPAGRPPAGGAPGLGSRFPGGRLGKGALITALLTALGYGGWKAYKGLTGGVQNVRDTRNKQMQELGLEGMY